MKRIWWLGLWMTMSMGLMGQTGPAMELWPVGQVPGALGTGTNDVPTLTPYLPEPGKATGAAMVICPGGGYGGLAQHEGHDYAEFLRGRGIACFVLRYRLGSHGYRHPVMLGDAARAVRLVRHRAGEWEVDPARIGIMGSSAGGHLVSTLLTHFDAGEESAADPVDRVSSRPSLGVLCYPVITLGRFTHEGSKRNLLGPDPKPELVELLSSEKQVKKDSPPTFLWHTWDDQAVPVENALLFAKAMREAGVKFDLHIYEAGRHGIGLQSRPPGFENPHPWVADLVFWLKGQGFVK
jgi:acetyl esterase/lipase